MSSQEEMGLYRRLSAVSTPAPPTLTSLPQEILEYIFLTLDHGDRLRLSRTCSTLHEIHTSSAQLQYSFTLKTTAYLDCPFVEMPESQHPDMNEINSNHPPRQMTDEMAMAETESEAGPSAQFQKRNPPPLSAFEKNEKLKAREERWMTMDAKHIRSFGVKGPERVYELQEGVFLMCDDYPDEEDLRPRSIRLFPLPSVDQPELQQLVKTERYRKMKFPIADLTMDPTQDLIVVSESRPASTDPSKLAPAHRYHLLTMSTFEPHPLAALSTLDFPPFTTTGQTRQLLQVLGDTLVVLVAHYSPQWIFAGLGLGGLAGLGTEEEIVAWNWKTGRVLMRCALPENGWFSSFALLTPTSFMLTSTSSISPLLPAEPRALGATFPPVIQIFSFAPDPSHSIIPVQPLDVEYMDETTARPVLLAQMEMPRFASGVTISAFDIRPDPAFAPRQADGGPMLGPSKPFTQDPYKGVVVIELRVGEPTGGIEGVNEALVKKSYELFLLRETLVEIALAGEERLKIARSENGNEDGLGVRGVERTSTWAEWAHDGARLMDVSMRRRSWVCSCSGYRFISLVPREEQGESEDDADDLRELIVPPRRSDLLLYDFSPYAVRKSRSSTLDDVDITENNEEERKSTIEVVNGPTILEKRRIWKDDVTSGLPFRAVRKNWGERANGVMIDDQRVIVIRTRTRENGDWSDVNQEMTVLCM